MAYDIVLAPDAGKALNLPGVTGLLGPNGAGKSTFIKVALGLYAPSRGSIRVFGEAPRGNLDVLRRIGYCPEIDKFFDRLGKRIQIKRYLVHTIKPGESLSGVAKIYYGDHHKFPIIAKFAPDN